LAESLSADYWGVILLLGSIVYASRVIGLVAIPAGAISPALERRLKLVPVAILTSLVAPNLLTLSGPREPDALLAAGATVVTAALTRQPILALVCGLLTLVLARALL
jgi:branched-subunit amino acid transport protein